MSTLLRPTWSRLLPVVAALVMAIASGSASAATPDLRIVIQHNGWMLVEGVNVDGKRVCSLETGNVFALSNNFRNDGSYWFTLANFDHEPQMTVSVKKDGWNIPPGTQMRYTIRWKVELIDWRTSNNAREGRRYEGTATGNGDIIWFTLPDDVTDILNNKIRLGSLIIMSFPDGGDDHLEITGPGSYSPLGKFFECHDRMKQPWPVPLPLPKVPQPYAQ